MGEIYLFNLLNYKQFTTIKCSTYAFYNMKGSKQSSMLNRQ